MNHKQLVVFDFDYTLAKTAECIWVWSPRGTREYQGKKYIPVHPSLLSKVKLGDDESISDDSFKEFYSLNINKAKPIIPTINLLKYYLSDCYEYKVYIVTARPQSVEKDIISFLKTCDVNTTNINYTGLTNSDPRKKIEYIKDVVSNNTYKKISVFEDNRYVIENIDKSVKQSIDVYHIESTGDILNINYYAK